LVTSLLFFLLFS